MKRNSIAAIMIGAIILSLLIILVPVGSRMVPVQAAISWTKYGGNPVLEEDSGEWDEGGVGGACVIMDDSTYKMWYTGLHVGPWPEIGYATSSNGRTWTKYGANPVLTKGAPGDWDDEGVGSCCVIKENDTSYKMWYTGTPDSSFGAIPAIGYATSSDGITWTKQGKVFQGTDAWEAAGVLSPSVMKEGSTYKMWYSGRADDGGIGSLQIGYATSPDGIAWTRDPGNPVLAKGGVGDWDERGIGVGTVIREDSTYMVWYTGYKGHGESEIEVAIGYASSSDGISWSNRSRVLTKGAGWETNGVGAPWVTYSSRTYRMWYSGLDTNFDSTLGYASYTEPRPTHRPKPKPPVTPPGTTDVWDYIDEDGVFTEGITAESEDCNCWITIDEGTIGLTEDGMPLSEITFEPMEEPPPLPDWVNVIGLVCDFGPDGATFDPPVILCRTYDPTVIPEGVAEENMVLAMWGEVDSEWVNLDSTVYPATHTICAPVSHFTPFAILAYTRPALFVTSDLAVVPEEVNIGEEATISVFVANTGNLAGSHEVILKIDNVEVATEDITLAGGASETVTFTISKDTDGTYIVGIDGLAATFEVKPAPTPPPPPTATPTNWVLIGGIIGGCMVVIIMGVAVFLVTRRRA